MDWFPYIHYITSTCLLRDVWMDWYPHIHNVTSTCISEGWMDGWREAEKQITNKGNYFGTNGPPLVIIPSYKMFLSI